MSAGLVSQLDCERPPARDLESHFFGFRPTFMCYMPSPVLASVGDTGERRASGTPPPRGRRCLRYRAVAQLTPGLAMTTNPTGCRALGVPPPGAHSQRVGEPPAPAPARQFQ